MGLFSFYIFLVIYKICCFAVAFIMNNIFSLDEGFMQKVQWTLKSWEMKEQKSEIFELELDLEKD